MAAPCFVNKKGFRDSKLIRKGKSTMTYEFKKKFLWGQSQVSVQIICKESEGDENTDRCLQGRTSSLPCHCDQ